jgi:hypothetical protein
MRLKKTLKCPYLKNNIKCVLLQEKKTSLTPKGRSPVFGPFLKFGQAIVDAIFVQKISNFW